MTIKHPNFVAAIHMSRGERGPIAVGALISLMQNYEEKIGKILKQKEKRGTPELQDFLAANHEAVKTAFAQTFLESLKDLGKPEHVNVTGYSLRFAFAKGKDAIPDILKQQFSAVEPELLQRLQALYYQFVDQVDSQLMRASKVAHNK